MQKFSELKEEASTDGPSVIHGQGINSLVGLLFLSKNVQNRPLLNLDNLTIDGSHRSPVDWTTSHLLQPSLDRSFWLLLLNCKVPF